jgi:hypothetical protein
MIGEAKDCGLKGSGNRREEPNLFSHLWREMAFDEKPVAGRA